ncbi:MAG: hypothetical protein IJG38_09925 [Thermoguttaceae bacterium]|nr:hypothetical protein [Thermoguttaceae bacterium]
MVEYRKFFVRFSGDGGRMTLNEKDDCWEYLCPGKGKIVAWLDPNDEDECVYLNVRFLDVNGNSLPKKENNAHISCALLIDSMGAIVLEFYPAPADLMWNLSYGDWTGVIRPDQVVGMPGVITFANNSFGVDYLLIPERPEFFPRKKREMTPEREAILKEDEEIITRMKEREKEMEQKARENIQRTNEEWDEWERRQAEENGEIKDKEQEK